MRKILKVLLGCLVDWIIPLHYEGNKENINKVKLNLFNQSSLTSFLSASSFFSVPHREKLSKRMEQRNSSQIIDAKKIRSCDLALASSLLRKEERGSHNFSCSSAQPIGVCMIQENHKGEKNTLIWQKPTQVAKYRPLLCAAEVVAPSSNFPLTLQFTSRSSSTQISFQPTMFPMLTMDTSSFC